MVDIKKMFEKVDGWLDGQAQKRGWLEGQRNRWLNG